ncbi:hydrolase [Salmonella enterica subsp. arizonae]|uniref:Hydrolase n=1 Tax=Salmonella enterica subsp. arizonae TaxID=59203 RepID=A0A379TCA7_SALER|nr:hydrolase [Salmonella enterica subsp. arizonae]
MRYPVPRLTIPSAGEDARARLYTLTEAPEQWSECLARWRQMNQTHVKFLKDGTAPKSADTWMLYQALTGRLAPGATTTGRNRFKRAENTL